ncbi:MULTISPECIES: hypothetical protein [unclassified Roseovarius]|jgi:hypothetical protein|uniref:hypothetical protein n=1 Tax=unclassified Roseovarius TaxID=2614913 RepID=UPI0000685B4F|nr:MULTISPECIES: hypothetical protein [unclassified Roseovarius]EAQ27072.1 hypothetical protein ROS217_21137 [Roseovarius sp. 217]KJS44970.1 MAG: hypothetical protein VR71_03780 [Roseovarius sp. BRH_c41]
MARDPMDPKGLIYESYRIEGITEPECRSVFLDWALSLPAGQEVQGAIAEMIGRYGTDHPAHPMTQVLSEGTASAGPARRRGGWRSRPRGSEGQS